MKCPNCGYENPEGTTFCRCCGKDLQMRQAPAPSASTVPISSPSTQTARRCVSCGRSIPWNANVCPYCGHDYRIQMYPSPTESISDGLKIVFYILSFLIPIVGIIIGIVLYSRPDPESKRVGKNCIIIALVVWGLVIVISLVVFFVVVNIGTAAIPSLLLP